MKHEILVASVLVLFSSALSAQELNQVNESIGANYVTYNSQEILVDGSTFGQVEGIPPGFTLVFTGGGWILVRGTGIPYVGINYNVIGDVDMDSVGIDSGRLGELSGRIVEGDIAMPRANLTETIIVPIIQSDFPDTVVIPRICIYGKFVEGGMPPECVSLVAPIVQRFSINSDNLFIDNSLE